MDKTSTTDTDNPTDGGADTSTTTTGPESAENQPAKGDKQEPSKSTDTTAADGDKKPADDTTTTTSSDKTEDNPTSPKFDDDLDSWIEGQKLAKPESDEQKQAYQDLRNGQREFTREQQAKREAADAKALGDEIDKAKTDNSEDDEEIEDPLEKDVKSLKDDLRAERTTRLQSEFYTTNKVTAEEHQQILSIMKEKFAKPATVEGKKAAIDYWGSTDALPDLLEIAQARVSKGASSTVADEAAQAERERIAKESEANSPGRSATVTSTNDKTSGQERTERLLARYS